MSANLYSRGAEDRKQVSLQELHKVRFGIVSVRSAKRERPMTADGARSRVETGRSGSCN